MVCCGQRVPQIIMTASGTPSTRAGSARTPRAALSTDSPPRAHPRLGPGSPGTPPGASVPAHPRPGSGGGRPRCLCGESLCVRSVKFDLLQYGVDGSAPHGWIQENPSCGRGQYNPSAARHPGRKKRRLARETVQPLSRERAAPQHPPTSHQARASFVVPMTPPSSMAERHPQHRQARGSPDCCTWRGWCGSRAPGPPADVQRRPAPSLPRPAITERPRTVARPMIRSWGSGDRVSTMPLSVLTRPGCSGFKRGLLNRDQFRSRNDSPASMDAAR